MLLAPGLRIGAYEIVEPLGAGGMGELYRARDTRLGRLVAIKLVAPHFAADQTATARLQREAQLASSLNHPGIVTVHDVGEIDNRAFVVMELIDGEPLSARLAAGRLSMREALIIGAQMADALAAAHAAGMVHRDLKPGNVMLTSDGRPKIVDFGLGKQAPIVAPNSDATTVVAAGEVLTTHGTIMGSAGYMAPEQIAGRLVDYRADQFALGCVLYEMFSGQRAFSKPTPVETLAAVLDGEPVPIAQWCPSLPAPARTAVDRCLAKNPEERYASTADLARDLHDALTSLTTPHVAPAPAPRRWIPITAILVAIVAVAIAVAALLRGRPAVDGAGASGAVRRIVVLPFTNVTKDGDDAVFCDGLVETLTSSLSQLERFQRTLRVVPASEVRRDRVDSAKAARDAFGATLAINGSLQRSGGTVRLTLNLVDAAELRQLASRTIDITERAMTATQDTVVNATAALLDLELAPAARSILAAGGTKVAAASDAYIRARGYLQRFDRRENIDRAIEQLTVALDADSRYALAHAALGEAYWRKYELDKDPVLIERAVASCARALEIDDRLAAVHVTLALIARGRGRYEEAMAAASRAVELDPIGSEGYRELGRAYQALNRFEDAERTYQRSIQARPDDWQVYNTLGSFYYSRGRYSEAEAPFRRVAELTPDNTRAYNNLGATYFALQRFDDAAAMFEKSLAIRPTATAAANLGTYYYDRRRYADAARAYERALALTPNDYRMWRNLGEALYLLPGASAKATAAFEEAVRLGEQARLVNPRSPEVHAHLVTAYSMLGKRDEMRATAAALERLAPTEAEILYALGNAYEQSGDREQALTWLEKALRAGYSREFVERSPSLASLRKDPRYLAFAR